MTSLVDRAPSEPLGAPLFPSATWFTPPVDMAHGTKISVVMDGEETGRVYGYVAPKDQCILDGRPGCWVVPSSPTGYAAAMQGRAITDDARVVPIANIGGGVNHAKDYVGWREAVDHYSNTASQLMRVAYGEDDYGVWAAGALWPEVTVREAVQIASSALSGDWRWRPELGAYDMSGAQLVSTPGLPHMRMVASLVDPDHPSYVGGLGGPPMVGAVGIGDDMATSHDEVMAAIINRLLDLEQVVADLSARLP